MIIMLDSSTCVSEEDNVRVCGTLISIVWYAWETSTQHARVRILKLVEGTYCRQLLNTIFRFIQPFSGAKSKDSVCNVILILKIQ